MICKVSGALDSIKELIAVKDAVAKFTWLSASLLYAHSSNDLNKGSWNYDIKLEFWPSTGFIMRTSSLIAPAA